MNRSAAPGALAGGPAFGILPALRLPGASLGTACRSSRPPPAAACRSGYISPASSRAFWFRLLLARAALRFASALAPPYLRPWPPCRRHSVRGRKRGASPGTARRTRGPPSAGRLTAPGADALGLARGPFLAGALALIFARAIHVPSGFSVGTQSGIPRPAGAVRLLVARLAHRAVRRGRSLAAPWAEALGDALGGTPVIPFQVGGPALLNADPALASMGGGRVLAASQA